MCETSAGNLKPYPDFGKPLPVVGVTIEPLGLNLLQLPLKNLKTTSVKDAIYDGFFRRIRSFMGGKLSAGVSVVFGGNGFDASWEENLNKYHRPDCNGNDAAEEPLERHLRGFMVDDLEERSDSLARNAVLPASPSLHGRNLLSTNEQFQFIKTNMVMLEGLLSKEPKVSFCGGPGCGVSGDDRQFEGSLVVKPTDSCTGVHLIASADKLTINSLMPLVMPDAPEMPVIGDVGLKDPSLSIRASYSPTLELNLTVAGALMVMDDPGEGAPGKDLYDLLVKVPDVDVALMWHVEGIMKVSFRFEIGWGDDELAMLARALNNVSGWIKPRKGKILAPITRP